MDLDQLTHINIPCNTENNHWFLVVIGFAEKRIRILDSLPSSRTRLEVHAVRLSLKSLRKHLHLVESGVGTWLCGTPTRLAVWCCLKL